MWIGTENDEKLRDFVILDSIVGREMWFDAEKVESRRYVIDVVEYFTSFQSELLDLRNLKLQTKVRDLRNH